MDRNIQQLIPKALAAVKAHLFKDPVRAIVWKELGGDISSFGAAVIQSGLLPTLSFYSDPSTVLPGKMNARQRRNLVLKALRSILDGSNAGNLLDYALRQCVANDCRFRFDDPNADMGRDYRFDPQKLARLQQRISDASVALKLALRTFKES